MTGPVRKLLTWTPRVMCIVFAAFISIFALDVFETGVPAWQVALALLMHLLPTFLVLAVLAVSWRHEWIGGILFVGLGIAWVTWAWGRPFFGWVPFVAISGPLFLAGGLFLLNWRYRADLRGA